MIALHIARTIAAVAAMLLLPACTESPPRPETDAPKLGGDAPRPADATANLPSDTGSQTTLPSGAVTGAGQPQGRTVQPDVGAPGGLERRARAEERAGEGAPRAARTSDNMNRKPAETNIRRARPARESKG